MTSNKEYIGRTTFTIFYSEYDKGVVDGVKQITILEIWMIFQNTT